MIEHDTDAPAIAIYADGSVDWVSGLTVGQARLLLTQTMQAMDRFVLVKPIKKGDAPLAFPQPVVARG